MKIAIYHGFEIIHFEMLGYLIEYFIKSKINIDIYADSININDLEWNEYYDKAFNINMNWIDCNIFNHEQYNYIILLTDDDYSFKEEWLIKYGKDKVIIIDHSAHIRRAEGNVLARIGTRFFSNRPSCLWALPCYNGINKKNKIDYLNKLNNINVTCIGIQNRPPSVFFLTNLFSNFEDITFHIISRNIEEIYTGYDNIKTYLYCPTKIMFEIVKISHYILCIDNPINSEPIANSMSGAIPISFSYGCNLIIPETWQKHYNFKSIIEYKENSKITLSKNIPLDSIYDELYYLISHKNKVFDKIIKNDSKKYYSKYGLILESLNLKLPNILITNNFISNISLDFREIHNDSNSNNIIPYCNIYNNIDYYKINEPFMKIFNNINNDSIKDIELISLRHFKDIIIIENLDISNLIPIINIYNKNKYCVYYTFENNVIIYSF